MRLTPPGAAALAVSAALLAAAYLLGYPRLAVLGLAGLAALTCSAASVWRRPGVRMRREIFPVRVTRGEPAVGVLTATSAGRPVPRLTAVETFGATDLPVPLPPLPRRATRDIAYQLPTARRAVVDVGPLRWERTGTFGFFRREQTQAGTERLYIYPVTYPLPLASALRARRFENATSDAAPDGTITFHQLREYVPGDDLRHIHWRSSARLDTLMVRHNIDVSVARTTVLLVNDPGGYPDPEWFEEAVSVAASAVLAAARERLPVRLLTSEGSSLSGAGGAGDPRLFLDFLAGVGLAPGGLPAAADRLDHADAGGVLLVAAGQLPAASVDLLRRVATRYDTAVLASLSGEGDSGGQTLTVIKISSAAGFSDRWAELTRK